MSRSLGEFEQLLLFAIMRLGNDAYGARIREEIEERTGKAPSAGAIYTGLERLQARGLVSSAVGEATPVRGGRRKKYYRLEAGGAAALQQTWKNVTGMADGLIPRLNELAKAGPRPRRRGA
jgi:PadR family transcriptional regulator, regulatory protein PadR